MLRRESTQRSFFDQTLYDRLIESDHFLRRLDAVIDFGFVHRVCRSCYAREVGRPAASPVMLFKMVLLQFLYDISDRRIVEEVRYHMAFKWFCGLEADGEPPHPTTLTHFRARLGPERFARKHRSARARAGPRLGPPLGRGRDPCGFADEQLQGGR